MISWASIALFSALLTATPPKETLRRNLLLGQWVGYTTQENKLGLASRYYFEITFSEQDSVLVGESVIRLEDDASTYATFNITVTYTNDEIQVKEVSIKEQAISEFAYWCLKSYGLSYTAKKDQFPSLTGKWTSGNCTGGGEVFLVKQAEE